MIPLEVWYRINLVNWLVDHKVKFTNVVRQINSKMYTDYEWYCSSPAENTRSRLLLIGNTRQYRRGLQIENYVAYIQDT